MLGKNKYYSLNNILKKDAQYNIIFGQRSNGKTYAVKKYGLEKYIKSGEQMAYVRRQDVDLGKSKCDNLFADMVENGTIANLTNGAYTHVYYYSGRWYLCYYDEDGNRHSDETPFCFAFSLTSMEHYKSTAYPGITTICFDEFISRNIYLADEFVIFENVLSTIIRHRTNVKIFMLGNTVNKYCPYFTEMGLKHIRQQKQGTIDLYTYGDTDLKVAVEYTKNNEKSKDSSNVYFSFDNPSLKMITSGAWEIAIYPHCPVKFAPKDIKFIYFIIFDEDILQCEIVMTEKENFTFIHPKTTEIKNPEKEIIYSQEYNPLPNYHRKITKPRSNLEKKIAWYFATDNVFYSDNETGEIVRNYLKWSDGDM
jgi:hypothetical protein